MDLLVAGCGYVGFAVARRWRDKGSRAYGLRRSPSALDALRAAGIEPLQADLLSPASLRKLPPCGAALLAQAPAGRGDDYRRTYVDGTRNFVAEAKRMGVKKLVLLSSTSVYGVDDGSWVDESTAAGRGGAGPEALVASEQAALAGFPGTMVLRLAGIYGPQRSAADRVRKGVVREFNPGEYTNRIHLEDIIAAVELLFDKGRPGEIYIGCDDVPATQKEFYAWLYGRMKLPVPPALLDAPAAPSGKRCSNRKIRALGLKLRFPDYKEGYRDLA